MNRLLVLGAGYYNRRVLALLREAGFHLLAVDGNPEARGASLAHDFQPIDIIDREAVLAHAQKNDIDGILPINDFGTRSAAYVAEKMGLPGNSMEAAERANDKGLMRECWQAAGLPSPNFKVVESIQDTEMAARDVRFPCVLKPTDAGGGGRGISIIRHENDVESSYRFAMPFAKNGRLIVEEFLDGTEMTIESISVDGCIHILATSDKWKPNLRTRVATSLNYPADISETMLREVEMLVQNAVHAVGIDMGMAHTEVIVTDRGPKLVETGARGGGGHIFHTIIEVVSGINAPVLAARLAVGQKVQISQVLRRGAVYRFFNPPVGLLQGVRGVEEARNIPGVLDIDIVKKKGDVVGVLKNSLERPGYVVTAGKNRKEAVAIADHVEEIVQFEIERIENSGDLSHESDL